MAKRSAHRRTEVKYPGRLSELARGVRLSLQMLAAGSFILQAPTSHAAPPPPPPPFNALPSAAASFVQSGTISGGTPVVDRATNTMAINQSSERAILQWNSFNIGSAATVNFNQPSAASVTLNRIDASSGASQIFGRLKATGQIYLLNQNGIVFGSGSQTNVGALVASSLNITQEALDNGIAGAFKQQKPAFTSFNDAQGNILPGGKIVVEQGASIEAKTGGKIMLFAPEVSNAGTIKTPDGQAILAAGQNVYLATSSDPTERGLLVEIDGGGSVSVEKMGQIVAEHGGVSLLGFAVRQDGLVRATTSVRANGTIQLLARDSVQPYSYGGVVTASPTRTGSVEFGKGSVTEVVVDNSPDTTVDVAKPLLSRIDVMGKQIHLHQDSRLSAKGGNVNLMALTNPTAELVKGSNNGSLLNKYNFYDLSNNPANSRTDGVSIQMEQGSLIDVSGNDATLAMSRNALQVDLHGTPLSDAPQQRNGVLQGKTITVDLRQGTPVANIDGATANIERTVAERLSTGGHVSVQSTGDIRFLSAAKIDVSGGKLNYLEGFINTTKLLSAGNVVDISQADPNRHYDAILGTYTLRDKKWGVARTWNILGGHGVYQPGYVEGKDAGGVNFAAPGLLLDGSLQGHTVIGPYQRDAARLPMGGQLAIGMASVGGLSDRLAPNVTFHADVPATSLDVNQLLPSALRDQLELSTRYLTDGGFTRTTVYSNGKVTVAADAPITLAPGALRLSPGASVATSSFAVTAAAVDIAADINAPGAAISLTGLPTGIAHPLPLPPTDTAGSVTLADGVTLNTRGVWTNDVADGAASQPLTPVAVNGGSINLAADTLTLGHNVILDASSGGWLASDGKLTGGNGGDITLKAATALNLGGGLTLRSHALGQGGTLAMTTTGLTVAGGTDAASLAEQQAWWNGPQHVGAGQALRLPSFIFERGGFANYKLTVQTNDARDTGFTIAPGAVIRPRMDNWILNNDFRRLASGTSIQDVAQVGRLADDQRHSTNLSFNTLGSTDNSLSQTNQPNFVMQAGAVIDTDPGAQVSISSANHLQVDGSITAPAGRISLALGPITTLFDPGRALWLGSTAVLDARGSAVLKPNDQGLRLGKMLAGGQVSLSAQDAYVIAASGSRIDVSGASAELDLPSGSGAAPGTTRTPVASAAGSVDIRSSEGMILDGTLLGRAAPTGNAGGGSLTLGVMPRTLADSGNTPIHFPTTDGTSKVLVQNQQARLPAGFKATDALPDSFNGKTYVSAQQIQEGGFDLLTLSTSSYIDLQGVSDPAHPLAAPTLNLNLHRGIVLDAPLLTTSNQSTVNLTAPYVAALGGGYLQDAKGGAGRLNVHANLVDLSNNTTLQGFGDTHLISSGDIRLSASAGRAGAFSTVGQLTLQANQVYPTTLTQFTLQAADNIQGAVTTPGAITIQSNPGGLHSSPVQSAGGKVILNATRIAQSGVLKAPFGQIELNAKQLMLDKDSLTSVSGEGQTVLFGHTENTDWVYGYDANRQEIYTAATQAVPQKKIALNGTDVDVKSGAQVDVSGGGDLLAYEWIPGPGGSKDALAPANTPNTYAILPALGQVYAPLDTQEYAGSTLHPGDSVYLAGGAGLAAGQYTLLPARYALLPGAYLVTAVAGYQDLQPGQSSSLLDGTPVLAGYRTVLGTDIRDSRSSGYALRPGSYATQLAEYKLSYGSQFFAARAAALELAAPRLPQDAGNFSISALNSIDLSGDLHAAAEQGRGAQVDIAAARLAVVVAPGDSSGLSGPYVELVADKLNRLGAESLLLGGQRSSVSAGTRVDVQSDAVRMTAGADLHGPEVMLVSRNTIDVDQNATLSGTGIALSNATADTLLLHGDGALLRVSAGPQAHIVRDGEQGLAGVLTVAAGARLQADRSMSLDASVDTRNQGQIAMTGGSLNLGASHITLGDTTGVTGGLALSNAALDRIKVDELVLTSRSSVDVHGNVDLNFKNLAIEAGGLLGSANPAGVTRVTASEGITLSNPGAIQLPVVSAPVQGGDLQLNADHLLLGKGNFAIQGYGKVNLTATQDIVTQGKGNLKVDSGLLTLGAARITGATGAAQTIDASGRVLIAAHAASTAATAQATQGLGARLTINALSIEDSGRIEQHSGDVILHANGTQAGDGVTVAPGAVIDVSGINQSFADALRGTPGGQVALIADKGDVKIDAAKVNVSAASAGGDGGSLTLSSTQGTVGIGSGSDLQGVAAAGAQGAGFTLDANTLAGSSALANGYTDLNSVLNNGGFNGARSLRLRSGDVFIEAGTETTAHQFSLTADRGRIDVAGKINAAGRTGGVVSLSAANGIALAQGSSVRANATGARARGGSVALRATDNGVFIADVVPNGAPIIDVSGGPADTTTGVAAGAGGRVDVRLPRSAALTVTNQDPTKRQLSIGANSINGSASTTVEAYQRYVLPAGSSGAGDVAGLSNLWLGDAATFMQQNATTIIAGLGRTGDNTFHLTPGIEVQSDGDLTLARNWDLSGQRFGGEPGVLTLRAAGNLNLNANLSDGFNGVLPNSPLLGNQNRSWSYRLVAGADTRSADVLALRSAATLTDAQGQASGDVNIANDVLLRTGTGDIDIAAGHSMKFGNLGSVIYTAGTTSGLELDKLAPTGRFPKPSTKYLPVNGGSLRILAQGDVIGPGLASDKTQLINEWLPQQKKITPRFTVNEAAGWWANYATFQQNIAAFGGGDVQIRAGGDITRLSASVPTTGYYDELAKQTVTVGGGDLTVRAGGDIKSGIFFVAHGTGTIRAGGALTSDRMVPIAQLQFNDPGSPLYTILAVMDGRFDVQTQGALTLQAVINPTLTPLQNISNPAAFSSYSATSGVSLHSVAGNIVLNPNDSTIVNSTLPRVSSADIYPGALEAVAFAGGIDVGSVGSNLMLYPAPRGNLQLLAAGDIQTSGGLLVSDADIRTLPSLSAPGTTIGNVIGDNALYLRTPAPTPVHTGDAEPIRIVTQNGDINGENSIWSFPKATVIQAGHDIRQIRLWGQNLAGTDVTRVAAGRDIQLVGGNEIRLGGPGQLMVQAGRTIDLGASEGVVTAGNLYNPALTGGGADVTVLAGSTVAPDYQAFDAHYLAMTGLDPVSGVLVDARARAIGDQYRQVMVNYVRKLRNNPDLASEVALAAYAALPEAQREPAILQGFYAELRAAGIEANQNKASNYVRGTGAIKILFPGDRYAGDLNLFFSRIYTLAGGDINLLVPGGLVNAGLASTPANAPNKTPSQLGIVAQGTGSVRAFARDDFLVNQSRVFTLQGGDILMWSTRGNIDAGRGAKTAISAPPPTFTTDANGKVTATFSDAVAGSGIRAIVTRPGITPGSVDLIAPQGEVNAGDAGIGAAGNLNIAAAQVRGADNIQVGGIATGVPAANSGGLAAGFAGAGDVAGSVSKSAEDAVKGLGKGAGIDGADSGMSFLDVEVIGYGTDSQNENDVELRKRKHKPTDGSGS